MCYIEAYYIFHTTGNEDASSCGGILIIYGSTTDAIKSLSHTLKFIDSWLQWFENNYFQETILYRKKIN